MGTLFTVAPKTVGEFDYLFENQSRAKFQDGRKVAENVVDVLIYLVSLILDTVRIHIMPIQTKIK